jgi:DNA-binding CsgD family transcriptional regulator
MLSVRLMRDGGQDVLLMRETVRSVPARPLKARGLSDREAEVLGWVMEGKTNPEIATILGLSRRTVHHHLENIYRKLGVETRTAAAKMARELAEAVAEEHG